jgi:hypothetical protein
MTNGNLNDPSLLRNKVVVEEQKTVVEVVEHATEVVVEDKHTDVTVSLIGVQGSAGPIGPLGPTGPLGVTGPSGEGLATGEGPPSAGTGVVGDIYLDYLTTDLWGPKTEAGWPGEPFFRSQIKSRYVHTQHSVSDTWLITHPLGGFPSISIVDSASSVVLGDVSYLSDTQVRVSFSAPFSGFAYLT